MSQGGSGLSSADIFWAGKGGYSDADIHTFCCKKHQILWCVCTDKGGGGL